ncbi:MAG: hypothetical protein D3906_02680 [Candidatus Electrothrix sp. AUS1_2]|nr:hypothetical protein [Candidatus Electrothrix sp. AUS1_2]
MLAILATILYSIAPAVIKIKFPVSFQDSLLAIIVGFLVSVLLGLEELGQVIEEKQREVKSIVKEIREFSGSIEEKQREIKNISERNVKFNRLIENKSLHKELVPLCENLTKVYSEGESIYTELIETRITDLREYTSEVAAKSVEVVRPLELASLPIKLMNTVQHSLDATCLWRERTMDEILEGKYLRRMDDALERGVTIRRIFIVDCLEQLYTDLEQRIKHDILVGVHVGIMKEEDYLSSQSGVATDFGIWDHTALWIYQSRGKNKNTASLLMNSEKIKLFTNKFEKNWEYCTKIT